MKIFIILFMIFFSNYSFAQKVEPTNKSARKIYQKHLSVIDRYFKLIETKNGYSGDANNNFEESTNFLAQLTQLVCNDYSFIGCEPTLENYKDWKTWYKLNKKNLYLDGDTVNIKGNPILVKNDPIKCFKRNLKLVKKSIRRKFFEDPPYIDAVQFLIDLTEIKEVEESDLDIPAKEQISSIEHWFKKNKDNLFWDVKTHSVKVN